MVLFVGLERRHIASAHWLEVTFSTVGEVIFDQ